MPSKKRQRVSNTVTNVPKAPESAPGPLPQSSSARDPVPDAHTKISDLPLEIHIEILSYFPAVPIPTLDALYYAPLLPPNTLERSDALRSLSQTCRALRTIFLPILWQRLEVCAIRTTKHANSDTSEEYKRGDMPGSWYLAISRALERKCLGLLQNSRQAECVQLVNVCLTRCSTGTVLPALVRCLEELPNLHTLQILRAHVKMTSHFKDSFEGHHLPNIRTAVLPSHAHHVLRCCSEVRMVVCNGDDGSKLVTAIAKGCKHVEVLEGFIPDAPMMKRIIKHVPKLCRIKIIQPVTVEVVKMLASFKQLSSIELQLRTPLTTKEEAFRAADQTGCIKAAREVLRNSKCKDRKSLVIHYVAEQFHLVSHSWRKTIDLESG